jgi:Mrp family chromosome partitioning ATPase/capsular polysaccharide biosynthesis protein
VNSAAPSSAPAGRDSISYWLALRDSWAVIAVGVVAALLAAAIVVSTTPKKYDAEADILVNPISSSDDTFVGLGLLHESAVSRSALTAARFIRNPQVADAVAARIGGQPNRLLNNVQAQPQGQSNILTVVARAGTPARAAQIANAFTNTMIAQQTQRFQSALKGVIAQLTHRLDVLQANGNGNSPQAATMSDRLAVLAPYIGQQDPTLNVTSPAVPRNHPVSPRTKLALAVATLAALLLGAGVVLVRELIRPRVREERQVPDGGKHVARLPRLKRRTASDFLSGQASLPSEALAAYRLLADGLFIDADVTFGERSIFIVAGPAPAPSKTITAVSLGALSASAGRRTIVVDADFRRPEVAEAFGVDDVRPDLADLLVEEEPGDVLRSLLSTDSSLSVVPLSSEGADKLASGRLDGFDPLGKQSLTRLFEELRTTADVIIVNAPSGADGAELIPFAAAGGGVLINVELGITTQKQLDELLRTLEEHDANISGIVLFTRARARVGRGGPPAHSYRAAPEARPPSGAEVVQRLPIRESLRPESRSVDPSG